MTNKEIASKLVVRLYGQAHCSREFQLMIDITTALDEAEKRGKALELKEAIDYMVALSDGRLYEPTPEDYLRRMALEEKDKLFRKAYSEGREAERTRRRKL